MKQLEYGPAHGSSTSLEFKQASPIYSASYSIIHTPLHDGKSRQFISNCFAVLQLRVFRE